MFDGYYLVCLSNASPLFHTISIFKSPTHQTVLHLIPPDHRRLHLHHLAKLFP
jgi:hypothetical protein